MGALHVMLSLQYDGIMLSLCPMQETQSLMSHLILLLVLILLAQSHSAFGI